MKDHKIIVTRSIWIHKALREIRSCKCLSRCQIRCDVEIQGEILGGGQLARGQPLFLSHAQATAAERAERAALERGRAAASRFITCATSISKGSASWPFSFCIFLAANMAAARAGKRRGAGACQTGQRQSRSVATSRPTAYEFLPRGPMRPARPIMLRRKGT